MFGADEDALKEQQAVYEEVCSFLGHGVALAACLLMADLFSSPFRGLRRPSRFVLFL